MKLSEWANKQGVSYQTAWNWFKTGKLPCKFTQMPTGTIIIHEEENIENKKTKVCIYTRVSGHQNKENLIGQSDRCQTFANAKGLQVDKIYKEIASGMNDKRKLLIEMLESKPTHIIVEHKDRLTRFGFNYLELLLKQHGCEILVLNRDSENETDLIKDLVSIITSFCCRLYGMRRCKNKVNKIKKELELPE